MELSKTSGWNKSQMADEIIAMLESGCSLNLGIGMPTLIAERIPDGMNVMIHSENGVLGVSGRPTPKTVSATLINAGKETIAVGKGASFFDSATSFGMIRGGHIDFSVLGGMGSGHARKSCQLDDSRQEGDGNGRCHGFGQWFQENYRDVDSLQQKRPLQTP